MVDYYYMCQSDNGSIDDTSALREWSNNYIRALDVTKDPRSALQLQNMFTSAGLLDVETRMIPLPLCGWPSGKTFLEWSLLNGGTNVSSYFALLSALVCIIMASLY